MQTHVQHVIPWPRRTRPIPRTVRTPLTWLEGALTLRDGDPVHVRAIHADDAERLRAFHARQSPDTIIFRFFHYMPTLPAAAAEHFTHVDYENRMALVATRGATKNAEILGVVRYDRIGPHTAEVAFIVDDHWQGHGIATALLHRLAAYARRYGITQFEAFTMGANARMLEVLRNAGYPERARFEGGEADVTLDISSPAAGEPTAP